MCVQQKWQNQKTVDECGALGFEEITVNAQRASFLKTRHDSWKTPHEDHRVSRAMHVLCIRTSLFMYVSMKSHSFVLRSLYLYRKQDRHFNFLKSSLITMMV